MFGLPKSTDIQKQLAKTAIYRRFNTPAKDQQIIDETISRLDIVNEISTTTTSINAGTEVSRFFVVKVQLKTQGYSIKAIQMLFNLIGQKCIFALSYGYQVCFACFNKRLFVTPWYNEDEVKFTISGISLDDVYNSIQAQIINIEHIEETSMDFQVDRKIKLDDLKAEFEKLKKLEKKEIQPHKKQELHLKVVNIKKEIERIESNPLLG